MVQILWVYSSGTIKEGKRENTETNKSKQVQFRVQILRFRLRCHTQLHLVLEVGLVWACPLE